MKVVVATLNQQKALEEAFSVIVKTDVLFAALNHTKLPTKLPCIRVSVSVETYLEEKVDNYCIIIIIAVTTCGHSECN